MSKSSRRDVLTSLVAGAAGSALWGAPAVAALAAPARDGSTPLFVGPFSPAEWFLAGKHSVLPKFEPEAERKRVNEYVAESLKATSIFIHDVVYHEGGERFAKEGYPVGVIKCPNKADLAPLKTKDYEYEFYVSGIDFVGLITSSTNGATRRIGAVIVRLRMIRSREGGCFPGTSVFPSSNLSDDNPIIYNARGQLIKAEPAPKKP